METAPTVKSSENGHSNQELEYYFDISRGTLLLGKFELDFYLATGAEESDIYELGELIRNSEIEINRDVIIPEKNWAQESRQSYIDYGHWLIKIAALPDNLTDSKQSQKNKINEKMIQRAYKLGLGPSRDHIMFESRFGSLTQFYIELGENKTSRRYVFKDWSEQDCLDYLSQVTNELGHFPKLSDLNEFAENDINRPTAESIKSILDYSIVEAATKIGQIHPRSWKIRPNIDLLDWGLDFMRANNGVVPTVSIMRKLSKQNLDDRYAPPSLTTTRRRFKKFSNYQKLLQIAYDQQLSNGSGDVQNQNTEASIFHNSVLIGIDFMHANSGQPLQEDNLVNLYKAGYLEVSPEEIFTIFEDIDDYNSEVSISYNEDVEKREQHKSDMLAEIESQNGELPAVLFRKVVKGRKSKKNMGSARNKSPRLGAVLDEIIPDNEKIVRYSRFKLINYLVPNGDMAMERKLSIALGFNLKTNKFSLTSISGELRKSDPNLTKAVVELAADELKLFDYIFPQFRQNHLNDLNIAAFDNQFTQV